MLFETTTEDYDGFLEAPRAGGAIELLTADHEDVKQLFMDYEDLVTDGAGAEERAQMARHICQALAAHATVEEELFYPAARDAIDQPALLDQTEAEHGRAKALIAQIERMSPDDAQYDATVMQLQEAIDQHVHEEEGELFPRVQDSEIDLELLGEQIAQRKEELLAEPEQAE